MSPRARVSAIVGACAVGAAAVVVVLTAVTHDSPPKPLPPRPGVPPFSGDYTAPEPLSAQVRRAVGDVNELSTLAKLHPGSSFVQINLGLALFWQRRNEAAIEAWRAAKRLQPDTPSSVKAGDLLHPDTPRGLPQFQPSFAQAVTPAQRKLVEGVRLQQSLRPLSAERAFRAALRLAPDDPDANVAAAVGLFDKDNPTPAFSRLGPLARRFPHAQVVRFHLGLLAIWIRDFTDARKQLRQAQLDGRSTRFGREAGLLLGRLGKVGTG